MVTKGKSRRSEENHINNYCKPAELVHVMVFSSDGPRSLLNGNGV